MKTSEALRKITHELYNLKLLKDTIEIVETGGTSGKLFDVKFRPEVMTDPDTMRYLMEVLNNNETK